MIFSSKNANLVVYGSMLKLSHKETRSNLHLHDIAWSGEQQLIAINSTKNISKSTRIAMIVILQVCVLIFFFGLDALLDYFIHLNMSNSLNAITRIVFDEISHAILSGSVWLLASIYSYEIKHTAQHNNILDMIRSICYRFHKEVFVSMLISNIIDIDHFIQAKSFSIFAATHLTSHPFAHTLLCCFTVTSVVFLISRNIQYTLLVFTSYITHLLRDSIRKGIWLGTEIINSIALNTQIPSVNTPPLSIWFVLVLYCFVIPILIR